MKKNTILVTGATGFIGANLVRKLVNLGHKPTILARKNSKFWRLDNLKDRITILETDIHDYELLKKDIGRVKPTYIFHLATYGAFQSTQQDIAETFDTNMMGTLHLLNACRELGFKYFVNTSSSSEYGIKKQPMKENDVLNAIDFYGITKVATTLTLKLLAHKQLLPIVTLRLFSPYGYYDDPSRFISTLIINAISNKKLKLSNPRYVRDFIFIEDVLDAYLYFLNGKQYQGEVFNIGSGRQTQLEDVVKIVEKILRKKLYIEWSSHLTNQEEPKRWQADIQKAKNKLYWKPKTDLYEGLEKTVNWFRENINLYGK